VKKWNYNRKTRNIYRFPHHFGSNLSPEPAPAHKKHYYFYNAIDFPLSVGTPIYAALDGIVDNVIDNFDIGGPDIKLIDYCNLVTVKHTFNEYSHYAHLEKDSVPVEEGQEVKKNQFLGLVGLTGFTSYPHLHFEVFKSMKDFPTLLVQFEYRNKIFTMRSPFE